MKKLLSLFLIITIILSFSACKSSDENNENTLDNTLDNKKITIVLYDENEYDTKISNTFIEKLNSLIPENKLNYNILNAKGDKKTLQKLLSSIKLDETLFIVPIGVTAARIVCSTLDGQIPIFFANVDNPVLNGLMSDETTPLTTTGVVSRVPANYIFNNFLSSIGDKSVGHIGIIFNTSEISPMKTTNDFKLHLDSNNYYYTESVVATSLEAQQAASKMLYKAVSGSSVTGEADLSKISKKYENRSDGVNMIFLSSDEIVSNASKNISEILVNSDYYVYTANPQSVVGENFVSLIPTSQSIGNALADMVFEFLSGKQISTLPCQTASEFEEIRLKADDKKSEQTAENEPTETENAPSQATTTESDTSATNNTEENTTNQQ